MRAPIAILTLLACTALDAAQPEAPAPRFSGGASLSAPISQSADQRFTLNGQLQANRLQSSGRFAVEARLMPDAKTAGALCGLPSDLIFRDGFDPP